MNIPNFNIFCQQWKLCNSPHNVYHSIVDIIIVWNPKLDLYIYLYKLDTAVQHSEYVTSDLRFHRKDVDYFVEKKEEIN